MELSIYIHWPYCLSKCPYCDFNSHVQQSVAPNDWGDAVGKQIIEGATFLGPRKITSIFFGGGTPSLMEPKLVEKIINEVGKQWHIKDNVEITLEANPNSSEAKKFGDLRQAGVNRLSLGVQSLVDRDLKFLGREHSANEAKAAAELARNIFPRSSIDLIYSRPDQTMDQWEQELREAMELINNHISVYQLTIEKGTPFYTRQKDGVLSMPNDDKAVQLYRQTQSLLKDFGLPAYEISNHALPGCESQHNLAYWLYKDYLGVGPGAHSRLTVDKQIYALSQVRSPAKWFKAGKMEHFIDTRGDGLTLLQSTREMIIMGLRLHQGISKKWFKRRTNCSLGEMLDPNILKNLSDNEFIINDAIKLQLTMRGRPLLNAILDRLLP
ncbi:MAG: radical SAM family heme chaperone HemW [Pseudomonadota bacterium]|nr:radical SAM family heme chaperone HemW [Pseudomonadota bacterium]